MTSSCNPIKHAIFGRIIRFFQHLIAKIATRSNPFTECSCSIVSPFIQQLLSPTVGVHECSIHVRREKNAIIYAFRMLRIPKNAYQKKEAFFDFHQDLISINALLI